MGAKDMIPLLEKNDPKTRMLLIGLAAGLAVLLIVLLLLTPLLPGTEDDPSDATTEQTESYPEELTVSQPEHPNGITLEETVTFAGISDPREVLTINGVEVERQADGSFSYDVALEVGVNTVTLVHKEQTLSYTVERKALVLSYGPMGNESYTSGETVHFELIVWKGSAVQVRFAHQDIEMEDITTLSSRDIPEGYVLYAGTCALPGDNQEDMDMGTATFTVTCGDMTESFESGKILCLKNAVSGVFGFVLQAGKLHAQSDESPIIVHKVLMLPSPNPIYLIDFRGRTVAVLDTTLCSAEFLSCVNEESALTAEIDGGG